MKDRITIDTIVNVTDTITKLQHIITLNTISGDNSQLMTNSVTILLGLIAGFIALYQVKSNIVSSARINWIENLRISISEYCSEVDICGTILTNMIQEGIKDGENNIEEAISKYYPSYIESTRKINLLGNKALLYLNSSETNHKKIEDLIEKISNHLHKGGVTKINQTVLEQDLKEIITASKIVFKTEWDKSKRIFRI